MSNENLNFQFWQKFLALIKPYWYPVSQDRGSFLGLLLLLAAFLSTTSFIIVIAISLGGQYYFPQIFNSIAPSFMDFVTQIPQSPVTYFIGLLLILIIAGFAYYKKQLQDHWHPWVMSTIILLLLLSSTGANVLSSYLNRDLITAMAQKQLSNYFPLLLLYSSSLVAIVPLMVLSQYIKRKLCLNWQQWLTNYFLDKYLYNRAYYNLKSNLDVDNPDQRISKEVESFTQTLLDFWVAIFNQFVNFIAYGIVLWSISKILVVILFVYSLLANLSVVFLSKRLVYLNGENFQYEANFRYALVRIRDNAESIAFSRGENQELSLLKQRLAKLMHNLNSIISWEGNIELLTVAYYNSIFIIPFLFLGPLYFNGQIDLGTVTQASMLCFQLSAAFSVIIRRFDTLSSLVAVINRLATFAEVLSEPKDKAKSVSTIEQVEDNRFALESMTLQTPDGEQTLIKDLSISVGTGEGILIMGASGLGKSSLLRAIAGLWDTGKGRIIQPSSEEIMFLPQRPYMILGSLRQQLLYPKVDCEITDKELESLLQQVNLSELVSKVGNFDVELDWSSILSIGEQQRLVFARLLLNQPRYAFLDEATSALDQQNEKHLYQQLQKTKTIFITVGHRQSLLNYHQRVLEIFNDSSWRLITVQDWHCINAG